MKYKSWEKKTLIVSQHTQKIKILLIYTKIKDEKTIQKTIFTPLEFSGGIPLLINLRNLCPI
jgi:hypothetical protein